jgi:hypothetical protein
VSRRAFAANVLVAAFGFMLAAGLVYELCTERPLPAAPARHAIQSATEAREHSDRPPAPIASYSQIATRNLFNPGRSEAVAVAALLAPGSKPILHGVVVDGERSRAFLEEPPAKQIFGYSVGDTIAGGRVESIGPDRVVIVRPGGPVEVLLQDPSKPKEVGTPADSPAGERARTGSTRRPGSGAVPSGTATQPQRQ